MIRMTFEEWQAEAERRFGTDQTKWRFVCPACGHVAAVEDFRPFKDRGASADSARCECLGRYTRPDAHFGTKPGPCNYAGYGLFRLSPVLVVSGGEEVHSFAFADPPAALTEGTVSP